MCGIVGAVAKRNVVPILIEGLKRLEYRGYDSAGVAVMNGLWNPWDGRERRGDGSSSGRWDGRERRRLRPAAEKPDGQENVG